MHHFTKYNWRQYVLATYAPLRQRYYYLLLLLLLLNETRRRNNKVHVNQQMCKYLENIVLRVSSAWKIYIIKFIWERLKINGLFYCRSEISGFVIPVC
jgi:hypothetical protein